MVKESAHQIAARKAVAAALSDLGKFQWSTYSRFVARGSAVYDKETGQAWCDAHTVFNPIEVLGVDVAQIIAHGLNRTLDLNALVESAKKFEEQAVPELKTPEDVRALFVQVLMRLDAIERRL